MTRIKKWFILLLFAGLLLSSAQSCTSLNTMYYWADTYITWQIDDYFALTGEQKKWVKGRLGELLQRYRQQEIPRYIDFLTEIKTRSRSQFTDADITWFREQLSTFNTAIATILAEDATLFLAGISSEQVRFLEKKLEEENRLWLEEQKEYDDKSRQEKLDIVYQDMEEWVGDLTEEQKSQIADVYTFEGLSSQARYQNRLQSQQQFLTILNQRSTEKELQATLLDWYLNADKRASQAYKEYRQNRNLRTQKLVFLLNRTATDKQRNHFAAKLESYIAELKKIVSG